MTTFDGVKDSGERRDFGTGSVRDVRTGKGRYDLLPPMFIKRLAQHLENGAVKYGDNNWKLGQPLSGFLDSGLRHGFNCLDLQVDEDHPAAAVWNFMAFMWTAEEIREGRLPRELDDIGYVAALEGRDQVTADEARSELAQMLSELATAPPMRFVMGIDHEAGQLSHDHTAFMPLPEAELVAYHDARDECVEQTTVLSDAGSPSTQDATFRVDSFGTVELFVDVELDALRRAQQESAERRLDAWSFDNGIL